MNQAVAKLSAALLLVCGIPQTLAAQEALADSNASVSELQTRLRADPSNADVLRQLAAAQAAALQYDAALATIDRAKAIAPQDNDIALARARILLWSGRPGEARIETQAVRARAPAYPELAEVETAIDSASAERAVRSGVAVSAEVARVDLAGGGSQGWETVSLSGFTALGDRETLTATVEHEARRSSDTRFSLSANHVAPSYELRLGASFTPDADFREGWGMQAGVDYRIHPNITLISDVRYADYPDLSVLSAVPGVRLQTADRAHALSLRLISIFRSDGDNRVGVSGRYDGELGNGYRAFAGAASYPDTEAGITRQLRSAFGGVALPVSDKVSLNITGEYDRRERSYTRKALVMSLIVRFGN
jgi:YaiO family outer membrane protein